MNNTIMCFIITIMSGLSTMLGCFLLTINVEKNKIVFISLFLSSIVMLYISIFDLIPASFGYINKIYEFVPSMMILAVYLLFGGMFVHMISKKRNKDNKLYKLGILSFLVLVIHNIPEGMITFISSTKNIDLGISLAISIALHNIPEGISIAIPIYYGSYDKKKAILYTLIAALSEPFGAFISFLFIDMVNDFLFAILLSVTAGIMIYLSIFELLKEAIKKDVYE